MVYFYAEVRWWRDSQVGMGFTARADLTVSKVGSRACLLGLLGLHMEHCPRHTPNTVRFETGPPAVRLSRLLAGEV